MTTDELRSLLRSVQVLVVGDVMLDEYLLGSVSRISPEAPVPVVDVKERRYVAGGAANVAANVASLGARARLLGVCGSDPAADMLHTVLAQSGIDSSGMVRCESHQTTSKTRVIAGQQQIVRYDCENRSEYPASVRSTLLAKFAKSMEDTDVFVLSDYKKGVLSPDFCSAAIGLANEARRRTIVDPKGSDYSKYRGCSLITPNLKEAGEAAGFPIESEQDLYKAGGRLLRSLPGSSILVTRGPDGMTLFRQDQAPLTIPTVARQVFDVVGAGDTAVAALAIAVGAGLPIDAGMRLSNIAAGIAVGKHGTVTVGFQELMEHAEVQELLTPLSPGQATHA